MAQQTMTEKDLYLATFEREAQTSLKVLRAYPPEQLDFRPTPRNRPARDIAWMLALSQMVVEPALELPELKPGTLPSAPKTLPEMVAAFEEAHRKAISRIRQTSDAGYNTTIRMPVAPKQMGEVRRAEVLWFMLHDTIHHRGQLSVYLRGAGGRLPSIYGPTADEPWT